MNKILNKQNRPKVSVIIPVYNGGNYINEAIDSALAQTYDNTEIIVVNDGSDDNDKTENIVLSYGDKVTYIKKENGGSSSALNCGIKNMTGEYFSWLSHDDLYEPERTQKMVEQIDRTIEKQVIICGSSLIDDKGKSIFHPLREVVGTLDSYELFIQFQKGVKINGCGILIPKHIIDEVGFFDERLTYVNDADYWYRLAIYGCNFTFIPDKLVKTRMHSEQVSIKKRYLYEEESKRLAERVLSATVSDQKNQKLLGIYEKKLLIDGKTDLLKEYLNKEYKLGIQEHLYLYYGALIRILKKIYKKCFLR